MWIFLKAIKAGKLDIELDEYENELKLYLEYINS